MLTNDNDDEIVRLMSALRDEKGLTPLLMIFLLVAVVVGVFLVNQRTNWLPRAANFETPKIAVCDSTNSAKKLIYLDKCADYSARQVAYECANGTTGVVGDPSTCTNYENFRDLFRRACAEKSNCPSPTPTPTPPVASTSPSSPIPISGVSCEIKVSKPDNSSQARKIDYSGVGGEVRVWVESEYLKSEFDAFADQKPPIRSYTGNFEGFGVVHSYQIGRCDGGGKDGCKSTIYELEVPDNNTYSIHCDVINNENKCSGYTACMGESPSGWGPVDCVKQLNMVSCGSSDNAGFNTYPPGPRPR